MSHSPPPLDPSQQQLAQLTRIMRGHRATSAAPLPPQPQPSTSSATHSELEERERQQQRLRKYMFNGVGGSREHSGTAMPSSYAPPHSPSAASSSASASAAAPSSSAALQSHIASDPELQSSLRSLSSSIGSAAAHHSAPYTRAETTPMHAPSASSFSSFLSHPSSLATSTEPSPALTPISMHNYGTHTTSMYGPSSSSSFASSMTSSAASSQLPPLSLQAQSSRAAVDAELARHEAALAHARQRLEAMLPPGQAAARFQQPYSVATPAAPSATAATPPHEEYKQASEAPSSRSSAVPPSRAVRWQDEQDEVDSLTLTSSGEEEEEEEEEERAPRPSARRSSQRAEVESQPRSRPGSARSKTEVKSKADVPTPRPVATKPKQAVNRGTFGSAPRSSLAPSTTTTTSSSHKKKSSSSSPARPSSARSASTTRSSAPATHTRDLSSHPSGSASTESETPLPPTTDDSSLMWAGRYKSLLKRNLTLTNKNKELSLRNQALQSTIHSLTDQVQQVSTQRDEAEQQAKSLEEKLSACKSVLRSERESASFHTHKHLQSLEASHLNAINKLKADHDAAIESMELQQAELKKKLKNMTLVWQGVQNKLDAKNNEYEQMKRESDDQIETLQSSLASSIQHANDTRTKLQRVEGTLKHREEELKATYDKLHTTLDHAERLAKELKETQTERTQILEAFHALSKWTDALVGPEGQLTTGLGQLERDADKLEQLKQQHKQDLKEVEEKQRKQVQKEHTQRKSEVERSQDPTLAHPPSSPSRRHPADLSFASRSPQRASNLRPSPSAEPPAVENLSTTAAASTAPSSAPSSSLTATSSPAYSLLPRSTALRQEAALPDSSSMPSAQQHLESMLSSRQIRITTTLTSAEYNSSSSQARSSQAQQQQQQQGEEASKQMTEERAHPLASSSYSYSPAHSFLREQTPSAPTTATSFLSSSAADPSHLQRTKHLEAGSSSNTSFSIAAPSLSSSTSASALAPSTANSTSSSSAPSDTLAQLQERLRRLNLQSQML